MSKAAHWGLIGLAIGFSTYLILMWIAKKKEREATSPQDLTVAHGLKIIAVVDLILIPAFMYWFGLQSGE